VHGIFQLPSGGRAFIPFRHAVAPAATVTTMAAKVYPAAKRGDLADFDGFDMAASLAAECPQLRHGSEFGKGADELHPLAPARAAWARLFGLALA
jgi:hypothetical protein